MACGDSLENLAVTTSGYTLDSPGTIPPLSPLGAPIYSEWYDLARRLSADANRKLNELGEIEGELSGGSYPKWNMLVGLNNDMTDAYNALPNPALTFSYGDARDQAMAVVRQALCLIESSQEAIEFYKPDTIKKSAIPTWVKVVAGGAVIVGVTAATIALVHHHRRKRLANPRNRTYEVWQHSTSKRWFVDDGHSRAATSPKGYPSAEEAEMSAEHLIEKRGESASIVRADAYDKAA